MPELSEKFRTRRAFITGAASGLGRSLAINLAGQGWTLALADRDEGGLTALKTEVLKLNSETRAETYNFDVSDYDAFKAAADSFVALHGGIDIGINCAGVGSGGCIDEVDIELYRRTIAVNLMGTINGCHIFAPVMKKQKSGHILNVGSAAAFVSPPRMSAYNISKAGVLSLSETLRAELADDNINVTVLMTTYVKTNLGKTSLGPDIYNRRAQRLMAEAELEPDGVARTVLKAMAGGALYVVLPGQARFLWRFKRLMPNRFWRFIKNEVAKRLPQLDNQ